MRIEAQPSSHLKNSLSGGRPARRIIAALALLLAAALPAPVSGGVLHPALQEELTQLAPGDETTALFILEEQADVASLDRALKIETATRRERHRRVVEELQRTARQTQGPFLSEVERRLASGEVSGYTAYWIANLVAVRGTRSALEELAARVDVAVAERSFRPVLIDPAGGIPPPPGDGGPRGIGVTPGLRAIRADQVWYDLGVNGSGAVVANLDTGVDGTHPALMDRWRGNNGHPWQECWLDVLGGGTQYPVDGGSHGTHVMGTITGLGAATEDTIGVAWGAQWIACNAISQGVGTEFDNDVITAYQWFADPDGDPMTVDDVPDVVQNSWRINEGFGGGYTDCDTRWWAVIDNCEAAGVVLTYSAGNEGPGEETIGSPPDRATTPFNAFSIGAVDATHYPWPYPIANWSSRGPTGCVVPPERKIKPEVVAPGVSVYSSIPGGGYSDSYSGTSMAGPHVAGVVGLMRSVNPDLDVQTIKEILISTARDEGTAGEDNTYGWGFIDAYEAVLQCFTGEYGTLAGSVTNASNGGTPVPGAQVTALENGRTFTTDDSGQYGGLIAAGTYTVRVTHPSFASELFYGVVVTQGHLTELDVSLEDILGPAFADIVYPPLLADPDAPIPVSGSITDFSAIVAAELRWRIDAGSWNVETMSILGNDRYEGFIPGQPVGSRIEFYLRATDVAGNVNVHPVGAPGAPYVLYVTEVAYWTDLETDPGWTLLEPGDATEGRWVRMDPYGTTYLGQPVEPEDDHTIDPGTLCFVTGAGSEGGPVGDSDVDAGCVTLTSPSIDLSGQSEALLSYWRWFGLASSPYGSLETLASSDGGTSWIRLEIVEQNDNSWRQVHHILPDIIELTEAVKVRFIACDFGPASLVEAAVDDIAIESLPAAPSGLEPGAPPVSGQLFVSRPNPFSRRTEIAFALSEPAWVTVQVFDAEGRRVRGLLAGRREAGVHTLTWNGRDDEGRKLPSGVYLTRVETSAGARHGKVILSR